MKMQFTSSKYYTSLGKVTIFLLLFFSIPVWAVKGHSAEIDSLTHILSENLSPHLLIPVLSRFAKLHEQTPEQLVYLKRQIKEAEKIDSIPAVYAALSDISVYYYNMKNGRDSLARWIQVIDSITQKRNEYPDVLFRAKSLYCQDLLWSGNYEESMSNITDLYQLAVDKKQNYGLMRCSECLGQIYQAICRDSDAVVTFQDALDRLQQLGGDDETELRLLSYQIESCLRTDMNEKTAAMLVTYHALIDKLNELNNTQNGLFPVNREYWLLYSFYTELYLKENKLDKAGEAIEKASHFEGSEFVEGDYAGRVYLSAKCRYYAQTGNLSSALYYIDKLLEEEHLPEVLQLKADILKKQGKQDEILALYDEINAYNTKRNNEMFLRQVNQLRTLYDINFEIMLKEQIKANQKQIREEHYQLVFFLSLITILIIILYMLYIYIRRTQRLKNDLLQEKNALLESKERLIHETMRADEASRMKSSFIAEISHEIRTPLNAIAGFSALLIDETTKPKEKMEYSAIIQNNTDLMLTLINDVLNLSKMKTGNVTFNFRKVPLEDCCRKALDSVRQSVREGVALTFRPASEKVIVKTDVMRLQQLLTNLLTNAIKFTEKGEINLAYTLEDDGKHVRITVTDTGIGIPPEKQKEIFTNDSNSEAGLGLSICNYIAKHLSGPDTIFLDTSYTAGARFVFIHPCETDTTNG